MSIDPEAPDREALLRAADAAEAAGRRLDAIDALMAANRSERDGAIEQRLVALRRQAYPDIVGQTGRPVWPPDHPDPFDGRVGRGQVPEVDGAELTAAVLGGAIRHHGALLVRNLVTHEVVARLRGDIDRAFDASRLEADGAPESETAPWFVPYRYAGDGYALGLGPRKWGLENGGVATVEAPPALFDVIDAFEDIGLREVLTDHLGERPAVASDKWTLRRVPSALLRADWHQDGAFLGDGVHTVNVWLALSTCGGDTDCAGLDVVPRRFDAVLETGTKGAEWNWTVGNGLVDELAAEGDEPVRPLFNPGDALLFDELYLHRSAVTLSPRDMMAEPGRTKTLERYAVESWFFAPSTYGDERFPLVF